jgi:hypothetical protein
MWQGEKVTPFYNTPERRAALEKAALAWLGTPFVPNACLRGHGVSCQKLAGSLYIETGFLPQGFEIPEAPMDWGHAHKNSLVKDFLAKLDKFQAIERSSIQVGDLIGFTEGGCIHHLGVVVAPSRFLLCSRKEGTVIRRIDDAVYLRLRAAVWRPIVA